MSDLEPLADELGELLSDHVGASAQGRPGARVFPGLAWRFLVKKGETDPTFQCESNSNLNVPVLVGKKFLNLYPFMV